MAEEIRIDLKSTADTSGVDAMGRAVKGIAGDSGKAAAGIGEIGKGSKDMARGLGEGAAAGNAAVAAMSQVASASQGGASGMLALARAGFAAGTSLKAVMASMGPIGMVAAAVGIAMGAVSLALKSGEDSAKAAKDKLDELNKANLEALKTQLSGATEEAKRFKDELEAAARAKDRISDAKLADKLATIKASDLSPEQKERAEVAVRRAREDEKRADAQKLLDDKADADAKTAARLAQIELDKATAEEIAAGKKARLEAAENNLPAFSGSARSGRGADVDSIPGRGGLAQALAAEQELEAAKRAAGPDIAATIKAAEEARKLATEERRKADEAAAESAAIAKRERDTQSAEDPYIANARKQTDRARAGQTPAEKAAFEKEKARIAALPKGVLDTQVATGLYTNEAAYSAVRGEDNWRKFNRGQAAQPTSGPGNQLQLGGGALATAIDSRIQLGGGPLGMSQVGAGNQITRGTLKPGSDTKDGTVKKAGEEIAGSMQEATASAGKAGEGMDAATKATKEFADAQAKANSATAETFVAQADVMGELTAGVSANSDAIKRIFEQLKTLRQQAAAARAKASGT